MTGGLRATGTLLAVAGGVWWAVGASAGSGLLGALGLLLPGLVVTGLLVVLARTRLDARGEGELFHRHRRLYSLVNLAQLLGILAVLVVGGRGGRPELIPPGIAAVVGLHFLPFARAFCWVGHAAVGAGLLLVAVAGVVLALGGSPAPDVQRAVGLAAAGVFWAGVLAAVLTRPRPRPRVGGPGADA